uniref:UBX domain-containing protein n=1 Tax=Timema douglasi TaxID=61478 RepID=A0A7R8VC22_TIMDO|nr:unnamed protein product [Timema douglasi]
MAGNKTLIVLAPNFRRQSVKVSPNTTILQILEEVCKKQDLNPEEYDIKHHNHVLDPSTIVRFSGLPNNAQLEMITSKKIRQESAITLGLQLESGARPMGDFLSSDSLWKVITKLCPEEANPDSNPVVIYMRREVAGKGELENTTLRHLGLMGGRAMLRFVHRTAEELHRQANVSAPLQRSQKLMEGEHKLDAPPEHPNLPEGPVADLISPNKDLKQFKPDQEMLSSVDTQQSLMSEVLSQSLVEGLSNNPMMVGNSSQDVMEVDSSEAKEDDLSMNMCGSDDTIASLKPRERLPEEEEIILLGERNAIAFNLNTAQTIRYEDLPEDFFELTLDDARSIYKELKKQREQMEEAPLTTSALRELEENKRVLNQLHHYRIVVLRIQFPDRTVLQGTFTPLEPVSAVMEFVRGHLADPQASFHLFTTPPKQVLLPEVRLIDAGCVPNALLHFGMDESLETGTYLKADILSQFTSVNAAEIAACRSRGLVPANRPVSAPARSNTSFEKPESSTSKQVGTSSDTNRPSPRQDAGPSNKVPKWFKPIK